ncbi:MAG: hypothetical protein KF708_22405 [Pirellulales bacterium]|nr:hypothetical protein [Pirellulales bacterium]
MSENPYQAPKEEDPAATKRLRRTLTRVAIYGLVVVCGAAIATACLWLAQAIDASKQIF